LAPERRREAGLAARHWGHRAAVRPRPEVCLEAASYRQPAACRERRVADRYAVMERRSAERLMEASSSLHRRGVAAGAGWSCPAELASESWWVKAAALFCRQAADRRPDPSAAQAGWSATAWLSASGWAQLEAACAPEARRSEAAFESAQPTEAVRQAAVGQPSAAQRAAAAEAAEAAAVGQPSAQRAAAEPGESAAGAAVAEARPVSAAEVPQREGAEARPASAAGVLRPAVGEERLASAERQQGAAARPARGARAARLRAADPFAAVACSCRPAVAPVRRRLKRFVPVTAHLRIASP
jgi:hypothetical protein